MFGEEYLNILPEWVGIFLAAIGIYRTWQLSMGQQYVADLAADRIRRVQSRDLSAGRPYLSFLMAVFFLVIVEIGWFVYFSMIIFRGRIYFLILSVSTAFLLFIFACFWLIRAIAGSRLASRLTNLDARDFASAEAAAKRLDNEAYFTAIVGVSCEVMLKAWHAHASDLPYPQYALAVLWFGSLAYFVARSWRRGIVGQRAAEVVRDPGASTAGELSPADGVAAHGVVERVARWLERSSGIRVVVRVGQTVGWISVLVGLGSLTYTYNKDSRSSVTQSQFQAWELIGQAARPGNGGMIGALEVLTKNEVDIRGTNFDRAYLEGGDFEKAIADGTSFKHADLSGANLSWGTFEDADFSDADLTGAYMVGFQRPAHYAFEKDWSRRDDVPRPVSAPRDDAERSSPVTIRNSPFGAHFERADLSTANLSRANLELAFFNGAKLKAAQLFRAQLMGATLTDASLEDADITLADFGVTGRPAIVTQQQLDDACDDPARPPLLPPGLKPPTKVCWQYRPSWQNHK